MPTQTSHHTPNISAYLMDHLYIPHTVHHLAKRPSIDANSEDYMAIALDKVMTALAYLHRAGKQYEQRCEAFWPFCAGSWAREEYKEQLAFAIDTLDGQWDVNGYAEESQEGFKTLLHVCAGNMGVGEDTMVVEDVIAAEELSDNAVALLREHVDERDAEDLEMAREIYRSCGSWRKFIVDSC